MGNSRQPVRETAELRHRIVDETEPTVDPTGQPQPASDEKPGIDRALSWLGSCVLEGFAAYGELMCPCLLDFPEDVSERTDEPHRPAPSPLPTQENPWSQSAELSHEVDIYAWLASAPSPSPPNHRRWFHFVAIWPKRHTMASKPSWCDGWICQTAGRCMIAASDAMRSAGPGNGSARPADRSAMLRQICWWPAWLLMAGLMLEPAAPAADPAALPPIAGEAAITPVPQPPPVDPLKLALGERLFNDRRLSHDNTLACSSCHDVRTNGADDSHRMTARDGSPMPFTTLSVFNAALSFRLDWQGDVRTLEVQAQASLEDPAHMASSIDELLHKLRADRESIRQFRAAYGRPPDRSSLLEAIATYERSLLTPGSRFDLWLTGDKTALSAKEQQGYALFQSLGCISCHRPGLIRPPPRPLRRDKCGWTKPLRGNL